MSGHHNHGFSVQKNYKKIILAIFLNCLITAAQLVGGFLTGSLSILSDSLHNFSDVLALGICLFAFWLSLKPHSLQKTFGYRRAEILAAFVNILFLLVIGLFLIKEALFRLYEPKAVDSVWVIYLALFSFVLNLFCCYILRSEKENSLNIGAAYLHLISDALTSLAVAFGGVVILYTKAYWVDSLLTLGISFYLISIALRSFKKTLSIIMQFVPSGLDLEKIEEVILKHKMIKNVHHVHLWQLDDKQIHFEAHLDFSEDLHLSQIQKCFSEIRSELKHKFKINHTVFQPETGQCKDSHLIFSS